MRTNLTVTITGDKAMIARLQKLDVSLLDMRTPMLTVSKFLTRYYSKAFVSQGGLFGKPWPRLNRQYEVQKAKEYPGRPPLIKIGKMQRSFTYGLAKNGTVIRNTANHFPYHQSSAPRKRLPRRVMMAINNSIEVQIYLIINQYVRSKVKA